jgi:hypothetical protein
VESRKYSDGLALIYGTSVLKFQSRDFYLSPNKSIYSTLVVILTLRIESVYVGVTKTSSIIGAQRTQYYFGIE